MSLPIKMPTGGQYMQQVQARVATLRTTAQARISQARARVQSMGLGSGGFLKNYLPSGIAPIKTYSAPVKTFARPRLGDRLRLAKPTNVTRAAPTGKAPVMTFAQPAQGVAPIKTFAKNNLRAIKTY